MNKLIIASALSAPLVAGAAGFGGYKLAQNQDAAAYAEDDGMAEVLSVVPVTRTVQVSDPRRECQSVPVTYTEYRDRDNANTPVNVAVGSVIGGAIGNQITGRGKREEGTIAGAVVGGYLGYEHAKRKNQPEAVTRTRYEQRCHTVRDYRSEQKTDGYDVTYRYQGQVFTTRMQNPPPPRFPVTLQVTPAAAAPLSG